MSNCKKYKNIILSGGGTRGILHLGALKCLEEENCLNLQTYVGTSVGAMISGLLAIGYNIQEIYDFILYFDFRTFKNISMSSILTDYGFDDGKIMIFILKKLIKNKVGNPDITLKELYEKTNKKLIIHSVCVNTKKSCFFDYENEPDMPVYLAIRMSISIPYLFTAVKYKDKLYVDGAIKDNYPMNIVNNEDLSNTIGLFIHSNNNDDTITNLEEYSMSIFNCLLDNTAINSQKYKDNTIFLNATNLPIVDFNMEKDQKEKLFNIGYESAKKYIEKVKLLIDDDDVNDENDVNNDDTNENSL